MRDPIEAIDEALYVARQNGLKMAVIDLSASAFAELRKHPTYVEENQNSIEPRIRGLRILVNGALWSPSFQIR